VPPTRIDAVLGIAKAYTTRVGAGPLPTEIGGEVEEALRARGQEFGASTGRPRRCGWFDALVVRYAIRVNGCDSLALTKLDVLDDLQEIPICVGYRFEGQTLEELPMDMDVMAACEPVYETMPGWKSSSVGVRDFAQLPVPAQKYIERLGELTGAEVGLVSTGPDRNHTIFRSRSTLASWFD
jgi:adenylosuccinate synthase